MKICDITMMIVIIIIAVKIIQISQGHRQNGTGPNPTTVTLQVIHDEHERGKRWLSGVLAKKKGESCWSIEKLINNALSSELLIPTTHLFFFKQVYEVSFLTADFSLTCDHLSAVSHAQIILAHRYQVHCELYCVSTDAFHNKTTSYSLKISPNHQNLTSCPVTESCSSRDIKLQIKWSIRANSPGPGPGPGPGPDNLPSESGPPTAPARINRCWSPALCCLHAPAVQRLTSELTANAHRCDQQTPQIQWTAPPSTSTHTQLLIHRQIRAHSPG